MAERRMFAKKITESDAFLDMPASTQALYFHLNMSADDDGFVNNPKKIQRMVGASTDDLKLLIAKSFIITFDSGIIVIKHWKMHNYIQSDRYKPTDYIDEKSLLTLKKNKAYSVNVSSSDTECIQDVSVGKVREGKVSLGKVREGKVSLGKVREVKSKEEKKTPFSPTAYIQEQSFSPSLEEKVLEWFSYKKERRESYKETGLKSLCTQIKNKANKYGEQVVIDLITECMANGWKGIIWDKLKSQPAQKNNSTNGNVFLDIAVEGNDVF
ncbi:phage replication initiation protein [Anaerotignum sp. MB30-C6]|uniref:phage replication initiation protein n=1 Tax=Anaerotignum sp. MB30-C6 TaxID=3070814 RepID=UPI0027DBD3E1|nr:phage replication initiation protein [Anaerotignum sp. MB30-C6]WMI81912.1 phage replication initiation protein [Anaerotignum sp. MB30-C6]